MEVLRLLVPAVAATLSTLAGCAQSVPPPPLMSPYPAGGHDYGYAEERVGDLWRVTYHGPWRALAIEPGPRSAQLDRAAAEANDLALWRAAQLTLAQRHPAFAILDRRTDTETDRRRGGWVDDPWWYGHPLGRRGLYRTWPTTYYVPGFAHGRARTTLTIRLERRAGPAALDAAATVRRLEPVYGQRPPQGF
jgi:hypothetical protein